MPPESDLIKLYSGKILKMAAEPIYRERLSKPDASVTKRSPLCGSAITVDINVESGIITHFGQDVRACALGQACSTIVGKAIVGRSLSEVHQLCYCYRSGLYQFRYEAARVYNENVCITIR